MGGEGEIEFAPWTTPIVDMQVELASLSFDAFERKLTAAFWELGGTGRFVATFEDVNAFRVLDEHGLTEFWRSERRMAGGRGKRTFRVRGHGWSRESDISFVMGTTDGWSYVVATVDDCLEVLTKTEPAITTH